MEHQGSAVLKSRDLVDEPVTKHRWKFHKWEDVDGLVGMFGLISQCRLCNLVRVHDVISDTTWFGAPGALKRNN